MVLVSPIDTSAKTSSAQAGYAERSGVLRVLLITVNPNLGSDNPCTNKKQPKTPLIKKELQKLLEENIITPTRHSTWVSNLLVVRKKKGEIRLWVDFRNLNLLS
jgi:hypothetical protein